MTNKIDELFNNVRIWSGVFVQILLIQGLTLTILDSYGYDILYTLTVFMGFNASLVTLYSIVWIIRCLEIKNE